MKTQVSFILLILSMPALCLASVTDVKGCLKQALAKENPLYQVPETNGSDGNSSYLVLICNGDPAKSLYESISGPSNPGDWNGKTQGDTKFLGEEGGASMCYHITRDASGEKVSDYNCSIRLNIDSKQMGKTLNSQMTPFPVK